MADNTRVRVAEGTWTAVRESALAVVTPPKHMRRE